MTVGQKFHFGTVWHLFLFCPLRIRPLLRDNFSNSLWIWSRVESFSGALFGFDFRFFGFHFMSLSWIRFGRRSHNSCFVPWMVWSLLFFYVKSLVPKPYIICILPAICLTTKFKNLAFCHGISPYDNNSTSKRAGRVVNLQDLLDQSSKWFGISSV